jgi:hypothetical protein
MLPFWGNQHPRPGIVAPESASHPVVGRGEEVVIGALVAQRDRGVAIQGWPVLDLGTGEADREAAAVPVRGLEEGRRDEDLAPGEPAPGVSDHVAHGPLAVVEEEVAATADVAVEGPQRIALQLIETAYHG